jgi:hypothetical protein
MQGVFTPMKAVEYVVKPTVLETDQPFDLTLSALFTAFVSTYEPKLETPPTLLSLESDSWRFTDVQTLRQAMLELDERGKLNLLYSEGVWGGKPELALVRGFLESLSSTWAEVTQDERTGTKSAPTK